ncbi:MAG: hypothetical protein COB79_01330 [Zetaproteobacteria bacterium]|nr:MAG: hypothetical protein COB79_01330 [Zetaproteobacteria bacterium]
MQKFATYAVISPEGCAAILWHDRKFAPQAAEALKPTAVDMQNFGLIDAIIDEPKEGAHRNLEKAADLLGDALYKSLEELLKVPQDKLLAAREKRLRDLGEFKAS